MMGWSSYLIWRDGGGFQGMAKWPLILYITNLLFNWSFSLVFFIGHQLKQVTFFPVNIQFSFINCIHFI
jgi:tryptophan-rich sensory protein